MSPGTFITSLILLLSCQLSLTAGAAFIALEEHFSTAGLIADPTTGLGQQTPQVLSKLESLSDERFKDMADGDIALQILSLAPTDISAQRAASINDYVAKAAANSIGKLKAFATLDMGDPVEAASELERCIKDLHFLGALIPNHANGSYYDGPNCHPFWSKAQELNVPIYLHPAQPTAKESAFWAGLPPQAIAPLSRYAWGWHANVAEHILRLFASELFDTFPHLKIIIGHDGEVLPFMLWRANRNLARIASPQQRSLTTVWKENVWITVSGMWDLAPFATVRRNTDVKRIMYSVDYPFENVTDGKAFMEEVKASGLVTEEEWARNWVEKIYARPPRGRTLPASTRLGPRRSQWSSITTSRSVTTCRKGLSNSPAKDIGSGYGYSSRIYSCDASRSFQPNFPALHDTYLVLVLCLFCSLGCLFNLQLGSFFQHLFLDPKSTSSV
jgi:predicted TIM-barrel fold metal-dependent hydrolase